MTQQPATPSDERLEDLLAQGIHDLICPEYRGGPSHMNYGPDEVDKAQGRLLAGRVIASLDDL